MLHNEERYTIPQDPNEFDMFQNELTSLLRDNPGAKGIPNDVAGNGLDLNSRWMTVHALCVNPATTNVANRAAQKALLAEYAAYASVVMHKYVVGNSTITAEEKTRLGVHALVTTRSRIQAPGTRPELHLDNSEAGFLHVNFRDEATQGRFGKPSGVGFIELRYQVGGTPPATAEAAPLVTTMSKSGTKIAFASDQKEQHVYMYGRWVSSKGEAGGWSEMATELIRI